MEIISRKEQIKKVLEKQGKSLTIDKLVKHTGISAQNIRRTLTTFEFNIVRVGPSRYDLAERNYKGKIFRYTPSKKEVEKGVLLGKEDVSLFLAGFKNFDIDINLVDDKKNKYILKKRRTSKILPFAYYSGIKKWYQSSGFKTGDDILFKCLDFNTHKFLIQRQKKEDRDKLKITVRNRKLANLVYDIIQHSPSKYESYLFLFRKYIFIYPFNNPVPPDNLNRALRHDKRFLISKYHQMLSWTGYKITGSFAIGLKRYYFKNNKNQYVPAVFQRDEFGRFAFCPLCGKRLLWEKDSGWRHPKNDLEWADAYIPKEFLKLVRKEKNSKVN